MQADRQRLKRLRRLERVREVARQAAAREAAEAESTRAQLEALAERTRLLAADYATRGGAQDGAMLRQTSRFAGGLQQIYATTAGDAARARGAADGKLAELGLAERRRAMVEERASEAARDLARGREVQPLGARRGLGTGLE